MMGTDQRVTKGLWTISCYEDGGWGEALEAARETAFLTPLFSRMATCVCVGGGSLKETKTVTLTQYYRAAGINNVPAVEKLKNNMSATLTGCKHTDSMPKHSKCPHCETS
jgi:hypothetical protein